MRLHLIGKRVLWSTLNISSSHFFSFAPVLRLPTRNEIQFFFSRCFKVSYHGFFSTYFFSIYFLFICKLIFSYILAFCRVVPKYYYYLRPLECILLFEIEKRHESNSIFTYVIKFFLYCFRFTFSVEVSFIHFFL
jgi:hypothetical protein